MTVEGSQDNVKPQEKLAMEEPAVEKQTDSQKELSSKLKEDPRIAGLIQEVPEAPPTETPKTETKLGPSTTITPLTPSPTTPRPPATSSTMPTVEATPLTKAAETKQPKRR